MESHEHFFMESHELRIKEKSENIIYNITSIKTHGHFSPRNKCMAQKNRIDRNRYKKPRTRCKLSRLKLKTKFMNRHFINELDKIGLQLIHITGTYMGRLNVLLEAKMHLSEDRQIHKTNRRHLENKPF